MNSPVDPDNADLARPEPRSRDVDRTEGLSTIAAVVAVAAVIIAGLLYIMEPPVGTPGTVTGETPTATTPAPAPKPNTGQ
jgi:hypothetical protein